MLRRSVFHSLVSERESFLHASGWGKSQPRAQPLFLVTEFLCDRERSLPCSVKLWNHAALARGNFAGIRFASSRLRLEFDDWPDGGAVMKEIEAVIDVFESQATR